MSEGDHRRYYTIAVGVAISTVRRRGMWSQLQVCAFVHNQISQSSLSRWENGTVLPDLYEMHLLKKVMGDSMVFELADVAFAELKKLRAPRSHRELQALAVAAAESYLRKSE